MNRKVALSIIFSLVLHIAVLFTSAFPNIFTRTNFSDNSGISEIKITIRLKEDKERYQVEHKKTLGEKSKKTKKKKLVKTKPSLSSKGSKSSGQNTLIASYLSQIRAAISKNKYKSRIAKRLNLKGKVKLSFEIHGPNKVHQLKIIESSKHASLDSSALKTVTMVENFPSIPKKLNKAKIPISMSIVYE